MMSGVIGVYFGVVLTPWKLVGFLGALDVRGPLGVGGPGHETRRPAGDSAQLLDHQPPSAARWSLRISSGAKTTRSAC